MSQQRIDAIRQAITQMNDFIMGQGIDSFSDEVKFAFADLLGQAADRITQLRQDLRENPEAPEAPGIPTGADLLWILSGGQEDAFVNYLRTFPDSGLNALLRNPTRLTQVIETLNRTMPQGERGQADGIEQAPINSSNIYGFQYDPQSRKLLVRFQGGNIYGYDGVPPGIFGVFQQGAVPARTKGKNQYGQWWRGKIPSLGAAFYQLIRQGGYAYQRLQ